jgi:hypothetical protein
LGSALARSPSRASSFSQVSRICPVIAAVSQAPVDGEVMGEEVAQPGVLAGADDILDAGVRPVGGVEVGVLAQPAFWCPRAGW